MLKSLVNTQMLEDEDYDFFKANTPLEFAVESLTELLDRETTVCL